MSRSFKKHPVYTDGRGGRKPWKRIANKVIRNHKSYLQDGKNYKKLYCSYDIHDYICRCSWEEYKEIYREDFEKDAKKLYRQWLRYFRIK